MPVVRPTVFTFFNVVANMAEPESRRARYINNAKFFRIELIYL